MEKNDSLQERVQEIEKKILTHPKFEKMVRRIKAIREIEKKAYARIVPHYQARIQREGLKSGEYIPIENIPIDPTLYDPQG